jgi:hypothetical protein
LTNLSQNPPTAPSTPPTASNILCGYGCRDGVAGVFGAASRMKVDDGIWLVSFMNYDLGYIDLEEKTLQPLENPFGAKV